MEPSKSVSTLDEFEQKSYSANVIAVRQQIEAIQLARKKTEAEKLKVISTIVIRELTTASTLIRTSGFRFLFHKQAKRVYTIGNNREFRAFLNEFFAINNEFRHLLGEIEREVEYRGIEAEVHRFSFYEKANHVLFIDRRNGEMLRLDGDSIVIVPNGTGGVFFQSPEKAEPIIWEDVEPQFCYFCERGFELDAPDWTRDCLLLPTLTGGLKFVGTLTPEEQRGLLLLNVYAIFFESIFPTKPINLATGPKGSGKTDLGRYIGRILCGKTFNVTRFRDDERDFITTCAKNHIVVLDNLEQRSKWLLDMIACIATGIEVSMRMLYTTLDEIKVKLNVFLFLNGIDPKLRRDDIADRLLIFQLDRLDAFKSEAEIEAENEKLLPQLWGELLLNLNGIIRRLKKNEAVAPGKFRLQDFEVFAKRLCSDPKKVERVLEKMEALRGDYSLANDNLCLLLDHWLDGAGNVERVVIAKELLAEFRCIAEKKDIDCYYSTPNSLGQKIHNIQPELQRIFGLEVIEGTGGAPYSYKFTRKRGA